MRNLWKNFLLVVIILLVVSALFAAFAEPFEAKETVSLTQLAKDIKEGSVENIAITGSELLVSYGEGVEKLSSKEQDAAITETLLNLGVTPEELASVMIESKQ
ncbi:MAG: cell division protein FtsH, partial [bacterium]|nr:cell division protein FtsH [bacterium]